MTLKSKNIHVLPTDKPSRLHLQNGNLVLHRLQYTLVAQHIYITSDEKFKDEDYFLNIAFDTVHTNGSTIDSQYCKKIILTTDQDLIKDGVWGIEDGFLEWFVKNPSCEEVEVEGSYLDETAFRYNITTYEIIIPKEEPKQVGIDWSGFPKSTQEKVGYVEPKQETPEEVELAILFHNTYEKLAPSFGYETREDTKSFDITTPNGKLMIAVCKEIIKCQQERMYSEEDIFKFLDFINNRYYGSFSIDKEDLEDWFKQFKNK